MVNQYNIIVLWGHKLHSHTHSYIHYAFYKTFNFLGYKCLWLDNNDNIDNYNLSNALFITEGQVDQNIPIRSDGTYLLHNCNGSRYINVKNKYNIQTITQTSLNTYKHTKLTDYAYYCGDCFTLCWATELLPDEITINIEKVKNNEINSNSHFLNFIGMPTLPWDNVKLWCDKNKITYKQYGGFSNNVSMNKNVKLIQNSIIAPAIQEQWQVDNGYIPCRIFKNISYGKLGITNNKFVYDIFKNDNIQLIYDDNTFNLLDKAINNNNNKELLIKQMEYVRDNHTFINRIYSLFEFLEIMNNK
jgi:hypothetical protein